MLKEIYLVHHTHMDIGYTDMPSEVMDQHLGHMDAVLDLCDAHRDAEVPFRWTCESAALVQDFHPDQTSVVSRSEDSHHRW